MKILHTGDWHIGKIVNDYSMIEDQIYILNQFFDVLDREKPDVIIIAGDVYDRSIPPKEAIELLDDTLTRIVREYKIPTFIISGNHDSSERLSFASKLLTDGNLFIVGKFNGEIEKVTLNDSYGPVNFYLLPYINPSYARFLFKDEAIKDHHSAMQYMMDKLKEEFNEKERNILINHNFISSSTGTADTSESERSLTVGGTEVIDCELIKHFDYVALGHLHKPQRVKFDHIRYSGSILKYSFSEVDHHKGITLVDLEEKENTTIAHCPLEPLRDMVTLEGTLEELTGKKFYSQLNTNDYINAILTDEKDIYDPLSRLRAVYPNVMQIERRNALVTNSGHQTREEMKEKSNLELFQDFYTYITGEELEEADLVETKAIMEGIRKGENDQ